MNLSSSTPHAGIHWQRVALPTNESDLPVHRAERLAGLVAGSQTSSLYKNLNKIIVANVKQEEARQYLHICRVNSAADTPLPCRGSDAPDVRDSVGTDTGTRNTRIWVRDRIGDGPGDHDARKHRSPCARSVFPNIHCPTRNQSQQIANRNPSSCVISTIVNKLQTHSHVLHFTLITILVVQSDSNNYSFKTTVLIS